MRGNSTRKMNIITEYLKEQKDGKLIELACSPLNRAWNQLIENHGEFQTLWCGDDEELHETDTWLLDSPALVEELICRTVEYGEVKTHTSETVSKARIEPEAPKIWAEQTENSSITSLGRKSKRRSSKATSSVSQERARAAAREADSAKLKVKQLKEKAQLEAKIAAQKAQLEAELVIQEAEHEAVVGDNVKIETTPQVKQEDVPMNDIKDSKQKVKKWLKTVSPEEEETDEEKENDISKPLLVNDQRLSKTQKMIYLKASVKGTAEKAIAGMFFDGTMYEKAFAELTQRFGNRALISKSLINKFLAIPAVQDENKSSLRLFVDNLHTIVGTLKTYGHEADLEAAANMQQIVTKLPSKIAVKWSRRKLQL
ncbi:hypothetical protein AWC38_SpisGene17626 [Stylophora pistillata]|uniref:Uncharacterized protein n=1 Tax=Stylophora pistillata TaxID=50429 RepID=A0A2B4RMI9_STYPI|nr:hypothetical protein AWC38_SpisGene17626 [Stylophora pistillata]